MATRTFEFSWVLTPVGGTYSSLDPDTRHARLAVALESFAQLVNAESDAMIAALTVDVPGEAALDVDPVRAELVARATALAATSGFWSGFTLSFNMIDMWRFDPGPPPELVCDHAAPSNLTLQVDGDPDVSFRVVLLGKCNDCQFQMSSGTE